ncbi:hypothetical protein TeGR_g6271 [Tetraparma gracilis]|uniref:REJ domain-containing protein n=1 Tax=Tetraparma gracilis TaxID=2962635 RepID=A0ABQ6MBN1_9STRA|nr:hypothetical protein TeGR_g6271 [Tetraparma gracilis]
MSKLLPSSRKSSASASSAAEGPFEAIDDATISLDMNRAGFCLKCADHNRSNKVEYECQPCRCQVYCKSCAMKLATGGKCKGCKEWVSHMSKIDPLAPPPRPDTPPTP